MCNPALVE